MEGEENCDKNVSPIERLEASIQAARLVIELIQNAMQLDSYKKHVTPNRDRVMAEWLVEETAELVDLVRSYVTEQMREAGIVRCNRKL